MFRKLENNWYHPRNNPIYPLGQLLRGQCLVCGLGSLRKCNGKKKKAKENFLTVVTVLEAKTCLPIVNVFFDVHLPIVIQKRKRDS